MWSGLLLEGRRSLHSCGGSAAFLLGPQGRNTGSHTLFEAGDRDGEEKNQKNIRSLLAVLTIDRPGVPYPAQTRTVS